MRTAMALTALALLVSGCSKDPEEKRKASERSMTEYMSSAKGKADLAKARAEGTRRFGGGGSGDMTAAKWAAAEGTWSGRLSDGRRVEVGVSRDGGGSIELLDAAGRSVAHASTSAALIGNALAGTTTAPPKALADWSKWSLSYSSTGPVLKNDKGVVVPAAHR